MSISNHRVIAQLKLHQSFGGGEVYSRFLCEAISAIGLQPLIVTHPEASYWENLSLPFKTIHLTANNNKEGISRIPKNAILINHAPMSRDDVQRASSTHKMLCITHMPFTGDPHSLDGYDRILGVSEHVNNSLRSKGITPWPTPLLGVSDVKRGPSQSVIKKNSEFDWDQRKVRDRFLGLTEPYWSKLRHKPTFNKTSDTITIAIVSRLTTIKKFPELLKSITPAIQEKHNVRIEIFGSGGYAQVRDIKKSIRPIASKVRFWGHQHDVESVYRNVDIVLSGLPEREALGLNLIEAQQLGVPVLAVKAPPFTETVSDGVTGWLYKDPREDNGRHFKQLLSKIADGKLQLDHTKREEHLEKFSMKSFSERINNALLDFLQ